VSDIARTTSICGIEVHPVADLFPLITGAEFDALVDDIRKHGQMEPIVLDRSGRIIDGRNRARACERLGIGPVSRAYLGVDEFQFVISHNLHRRHLNDAQRALIAARLAQRSSGVRTTQVCNIADQVDRTESEVAALFHVGLRTVGSAKLVIREGCEALQQLVADGEVPVATAARVAQWSSPEAQQVYVEAVRSGVDPVKAAPPKTTNRPPTPPKFGGNRRKNLEVLRASVTSLEGIVIALAEITELDQTVTAEEAARLKGDLSNPLKVLKHINDLIKERSQS
jgi:ParB-like chromosome segregation protein Spo0J